MNPSRTPGPSGPVSAAAAALAVGAAAVTGVAQPVVTSLSDSVRPRSGRLILHGSGFGAAPPADGGVLIGGAGAIITQWTASRIHAYVPEASALGPVEVAVVTGEGVSAPAALEVRARRADGRIRWVFELDRWMTRQFTAVGPGGTVYTADQLGLYALSPDGALLWFHRGAGGVYPVAVGPDGTIYAGRVLNGGTLLIRAINPDGTTRWEFHDAVNGHSLKVGPNVGPDGNIYAAAERFSSPLGAFSLDPDGDLRWQDEGDPELISTVGPALTASDIVFFGDRLYFGWMFTNATPQTFGFDADDGEQRLYTGNGGVGVPFHSFPRVDPQGRIIGEWGQTGLIAVEPDGDIAWITPHPSQINVHRPTIDSQGAAYSGAQRAEMWAVEPDGDIRWVLPTVFLESFTKLGISPDDAVLVTHYHRPSPEPAAISGHDPADGSFLWVVDLPDIDGSLQAVTSIEPTFTPDSATAYITASTGSTSLDASRLYAIRITDDRCAGDWSADGAVDSGDISAFLTVWLASIQGGTPDADFNGDGVVNSADISAFLTAWLHAVLNGC